VHIFQAIPGVPKIKDGDNPATWMLDISSTLVEANIEVDFAEIYAKSTLYRYDFSCFSYVIFLVFEFILVLSL